MQLIRVAKLKLGVEPDDWAKTGLQIGSVKVQPRVVRADAKGLVLVASTMLTARPKITRDALVVIPEQSRLLLEEAIEHFANLAAIALHTSRQVSSLGPQVALEPESDEDRALLDNARGLQMTEAGHAVSATQLRLQQASLSHLVDRFDGVALLAEALCHSHQAGRLRELIRVFERAFALGGRKLISPLTTLLESADRGYTREEVERWIDLRDRVSHADRRRRIAFEGDVSRFVPRVEQAAYDVLLNKENWRMPDSSRRSAWRPTSGTLGGADLFITQGEGVKISFQVFDAFGRWPLALQGLSAVPSNWWVKRRSEFDEQ